MLERYLLPCLLASALVAAGLRPQGPASGRQERAGRGEAPPAENAGPRVLGPDDVPQDPGLPGSCPPRAAAIVRRIPALHSDTTGRCGHELRELTAVADGFLALWSDARDGFAGAYFVRFDREGQPIGTDRSLEANPLGGGVLQASVSGAPDGSAMFTWRPSRLSGGLFAMRWMEPDGSFASREHPVRSPEDPRPREVLTLLGNLSPVGPDAVSAVFGKDGGAVAWTRFGRAYLREFDATGRVRDKVDLLNPRALPVTQSPLLAAGRRGELLCVWQNEDTLALYGRSASGGGWSSAVGQGQLLRCVAEPRGEGWWIFLKRKGRAVLRHASSHGVFDGEDRFAFDGAWTGADLAVGAAGVIVLVARPAPSPGPALELIRLSPEDAKPLDAPRTILAQAEAPLLAPRVAMVGESCLAAWSERRGNDVDVYASAGTLAGSPPPEGSAFSAPRRLNSDAASSDQTDADVAGAGEFARVVWTDRRTGTLRVGLRALDGSGAEVGEERFVPAAFPGGATAPSPSSEGESESGDQLGGEPGTHPAVAVHPEGKSLVLWLGPDGRGSVRVRGQVFGADLQPAHGALDLDPDSARAAATFPPAAACSLGERGFVAAWIRISAARESSLMARRIALDGSPAGEAREIAKGGKLRNPALARLDDGRFVLAWDVEPSPGARRLRAVVLEGDLAPGREMGFETMYPGSDWDPCVAPSSSGGFLLAWTAGEDSKRDVFARFFDARGRPASRPMALGARAGAQESPSLARLADRTFLAAWQDDLSGSERVCARRVTEGAGPPGPVVWVTLGVDETLPLDLAPRATQLAGCALLTWTRAAQSRGLDVGACLLGNAFDAVEGR
jgi:hypothetical protein